jgi:hypothetical protein
MPRARHQWSIAKGLEHTDIMRLKRSAHTVPAPRVANTTAGKQPAPAAAAAATAGAVIDREPLISRTTGGLCFDFDSRDYRMYLAGACVGEGGWWGRKLLFRKLGHAGIATCTAHQGMPA